MTRFIRTEIAGLFILEPDFHCDERGSFGRLSCPDEFASAGTSFRPIQTSVSRNKAMHTLRGMHYCLETEAKLVRCVRGSILDVVFDIRADSPSFRRAVGLHLDSNHLRGLYVPAGLAHGFLTLEPDSDVIYQIDRIYKPGFDAGLRWNDPAFGFDWPATPAVIGSRDSSWPDFDR
jgi:dTDP-4-dehydrorhamnose 3,5-epimerase